MNSHTLMLAALSLGMAAHAQTMNVRGKVSDGSGKAVANAIVELAISKRKDTTAADGAFAFQGAVDVLRRVAQSQSGDIALERGVLVLSLAVPAPMRVEILDVQGNLLDRKSMDKASAGVYRLDLSGKFPSGKLLIVKAALGSEVKTFQYFQAAGGDGASAMAVERSAPAGARLAKMSAVVDTLKVSAAGFAPKNVPLSSYDTTVNVALDSAGDYWGGLKNPPGNSAGCGKATTVTNGKKTIMSRNQQRSYIIDIPANYDMNKPYRFFYCSHWIGARAEDVVGQNYYFLKPLAAAANEPAIFLAAQALPGNPGGTWSSNDSIDNVLFMDILAYVKQNLCIDTTRVFATGFSFGGMMTYSLSENRQRQIRAAVGISAANWNIYVPPKTHQPIAWMGTTGLVGDNLTPWVSNDSRKEGGKYINLGHAADNGCTIPTTDFPTWKSGAHVCYDFQGCKAGYPVKACTFGGGHTNINSDPGKTDNWIASESWKFFTQF